MCYSILDDIEVYEEQTSFKIEELITISSFLNTFVYKMIWDGILGECMYKHWKRGPLVVKIVSCMKQKTQKGKNWSCSIVFTGGWWCFMNVTAGDDSAPMTTGCASKYRLISWKKLPLWLILNCSVISLKTHLTIRDLKPSLLFQELEKGKKRAQLLLQYIPHVIPHKNVSKPNQNTLLFL